MPLAKARRLVPPLPPSSPPLLYAYYCPIYRPFLLRLSDCLVVSLFFSPLARWSTKLARDPRRPLSLPVSSRLVRLLSRGPSCFVPSVPGAQCDIYGFLLGPCVEAAIIPKRARERKREAFPRLRRPSLYPLAWIQARSVVHRVGTSSRSRRRRRRRRR